jgi:hypothetical protein
MSSMTRPRYASMETLRADATPGGVPRRSVGGVAVTGVTGAVWLTVVAIRPF